MMRKIYWVTLLKKQKKNKSKKKKKKKKKKKSKKKGKPIVLNFSHLIIKE